MRFRNAIFAGGGSRCFWQLGFWKGAADGGLDLRESVQFVGSTSAGCAIATAAVLGRPFHALDVFKDLTSRNPRNVHWGNLSPFRRAPLLPHSTMYRKALDVFLDGDDLRTLQRHSLHFLMSGFPRWARGSAGTLVGMSIYAVEQTLYNPIHSRWPMRAGFRPIVGRAEECENKEQLIDMVLAASCVPPVLPGGRHGTEEVLDGGLIDNVPTLLADGRPGQTLVLLSQRYETPLPTRSHTTYVQPSKRIRIDKFDYANPEGLQETFELGASDGERFARTRFAQTSTS